MAWGLGLGAEGVGLRAERWAKKGRELSAWGSGLRACGFGFLKSVMKLQGRSLPHFTSGEVACPRSALSSRTRRAPGYKGGHTGCHTR